ncbi:LuxR family transcriptional regulator [Magnetospirillum sp. 15-1]|uniref:helix-turn-helix transcriptional regulator n=1 Tax=Magnetospirillum sp. 15-1 TaxID=1979370 RepID=UPI000BBBFA48|nr:LuxR family transcriptional regulator [Magnetospirillum sp. 15-1]
MSEEAPAMSKSVTEAAADFTKAHDGNDLWYRLHRQLERFEIGEAIYGTEAAPDPEREVIPIFNSIDPSWLEDKLSNGLFECDEYVRAARIDITPMLWSDMALIKAMSPTARKSFSLDLDYGILTGVSIPMRFAGDWGASSIGLHANGLTLPEFDRIWANHQSSIIAIVNAFDTAMRGSHVSELFPLSPQERECLLWLAAGLQQKQVADRLRLTDKQVEKRLKEARRKLKAVTTTQAVANALIFGLIDP